MPKFLDFRRISMIFIKISRFFKKFLKFSKIPKTPRSAPRSLKHLQKRQIECTSCAPRSGAQGVLNGVGGFSYGFHIFTLSKVSKFPHFVYYNSGQTRIESMEDPWEDLGKNMGEVQNCPRESKPSHLPKSLFLILLLWLIGLLPTLTLAGFEPAGLLPGPLNVNGDRTSGWPCRKSTTDPLRHGDNWQSPTKRYL